MLPESDPQLFQCSHAQGEAEDLHGLLQLLHGREARRDADVAVGGVVSAGIGCSGGRHGHTGPGAQSERALRRTGHGVA